MQKYWLKRGLYNRLTVVALGWSADENMVAEFDFGDTDVLCVYDYRNIESLTVETQGYSYKTLVAWSFGVWAAERFGVSFDLSIAIGGSPRPVDDDFGIPHRIFSLTLRGIERNGIEEFNRRMSDSLPMPTSTRELAEQIEELRILGEKSVKSAETNFEWNKAIICLQDSIFPVESLRCIWRIKDVAVIEIDSPHYPFANSYFFEIYRRLTTVTSRGESNLCQ